MILFPSVLPVFLLPPCMCTTSYHHVISSARTSLPIPLRPCSHTPVLPRQSLSGSKVSQFETFGGNYMIFADFSKAFDTICFRNLITKMSKLGFSRDFLIWTLNYVMHRKQLVQIDETCSEVKNVNCGVPKAPS